ncbi:MAG TPA: ABC transporter ATP-binding protein [Thermoanaerobaculaceae bacterium]|nr:ABC transporter ATP-binding protein [Thermoanaerobaculaceae bacterium]
MSEAGDGGRVAAFEGVTIRYGRTVAADRVTLAVGRGCVYALLGRNGAGKSSLVRCLLGQQRPASGRATLFGEDAWSSRRRAMTRVGVVPEEPDVPPEMTAAEAVAFCARLYPEFDEAGAAERLARFGVPTAVPAGRLSKGQKGQLGLTLALAPRPELLVLDDPTLGLDAVARKALYEELVGELADRGTTVVLTTHDLAGVEAIADRVGVLVRGTLVLDEELEALKARFRRVRFATADPVAVPAEPLAPLSPLGVARGAFGVETVVTRFDEASFERLRAHPGAPEPEASGMSLEEIFIAVNGDGREVVR